MKQLNFIIESLKRERTFPYVRWFIIFTLTLIAKFYFIVVEMINNSY